jgi:hypothetical protein
MIKSKTPSISRGNPVMRRCARHNNGHGGREGGDEGEDGGN